MLNDFFRLLKQYENVTLTPNLLKILENRLNESLKREFYHKHRIAINKTSKKLNQFYKQRLKAQKKGILSLAEFDKLQQLKSLNRKSDKPKKVSELREYVYKQRAKREKIIKISNKDKLNNKAYKSILKKRLAYMSRQIKDDDRVAKIHKQVMTALENRVLPITDKEILALKSAINKREYSKKQEYAFANHHQHILQSDLDLAIFKDTKAIGILWVTCDDERVVGNPYGIYPQPTKEHGDHYSRHNQYIFFKDSPYVEKGLISKANVTFYEDLKDGGFTAYNCRCYGIPIYSIDELDDIYLTKKGIKFRDKQR